MARQIVVSNEEDLEQIKNFENEGGYPADIIFVVAKPNEPQVPPETELMIAA
jgi:hypothetical protein